MKPISHALLIDDEKFDQILYRRIIKTSGAVEKLDVFSYAEEALTFLRESTARPEVIFLDINMPRMNGFQFIEAASRDLGATFAEFVVVMLTTSVDPEDRRRACSFDVVKMFLNKPLKTEDVATVANLLSGRKGADGAAPRAAMR